MVLIDKLYFTLREIAGRWSLQMDDLAYMAENGLLRTSVRVDGVHLERGLVEKDGEQEIRIPRERTWFTGLLDLKPRDAFRVFRTGKAHVVQLHAEADAYAALIDPTCPATVKAKHLVVRRDECDRVETLHSSAGCSVAEGIAFQPSVDFRHVRLGELRLVLGPMQAMVVRQLHAAAQAGAPWCIGKVILAEAGATSHRMSDVFKSQPQWRELIESDGRGRYRLRLAPR